MDNIILQLIYTFDYHFLIKNKKCNGKKKSRAFFFFFWTVERGKMEGSDSEVPCATKSLEEDGAAATCKETVSLTIAQN